MGLPFKYGSQNPVNRDCLASFYHRSLPLKIIVYANKYFIWLLMLSSPGVDQTQGKNHAPDKTNDKTKIKWTKNEPPVLLGL
ncbi:hypothetical protein [Parabacteroides sp. ZJ-118]|uniref:hypothetical protein n=1 Tax=Parabacteroides sp. ZJ-118 TaxID=2709398 RepID=UPI0013EC9DEB|nr:hypothetical protein [Parabacteroides sp. ZJ-118]